jgi:hypothetical protein
MGTNRSLLIILAGLVSMGVAACGSSGTTGASSTTSAAATSSAPASSSAPATSSSAPATSGNAAAEKTIAANWVAFFSAKTPTSKRVALLQDGSMFATIIKSQAGSSLAGSASARVTKVTVVSPTQAKVTYDILVGGQPALSGKSGVAVKQGGTWKVGVASFCGLLALENGGKTSGLPSACQAAG